MAEPIDPRDFGAMENKVDQLEKTVASLEHKVDTLIDMANRGKGAYWAGMFIASGIGGVIALFGKYIIIR
jgi:hypothetical protein